MTSSSLAPGVYSFTAKQTDAAGNGPSVESSGLSVEINTTVPAAPSAPDLDSGSDSGPLDTDNITNDTTPTFTGTGPASTAIDLYAGAVVVGNTTSSAGGDWTITSSALSAGTYSFTAKATNVNGTSPASAALSVTIYTSLAVTINQQSDQPDPTATSPINFRVVFTNPVGNFSGSDVSIGGTAGGSRPPRCPGGPTYNVAVTGMTTTGTIIPTIARRRGQRCRRQPQHGLHQHGQHGPLDAGRRPVTINQAVGQADPTGDLADQLHGRLQRVGDRLRHRRRDDQRHGGGVKTATVTGSGTTYNVAVSGMTTAGTVIATVRRGRCAEQRPAEPRLDQHRQHGHLGAGRPTVTINQAAGQADPTAQSPINFTVVFSVAVTGFATGDVTITGTAGRHQDARRSPAAGPPTTWPSPA